MMYSKGDLISEMQEEHVSHTEEVVEVPPVYHFGIIDQSYQRMVQHVMNVLEDGGTEAGSLQPA